MNIHVRSLLVNVAIIGVVFSILWFHDFGSWSYLVSVFLFAGASILHLWMRDGKLLNKHMKIFIIIMIISVCLTFVGEMAALSWRIWAYYPGRTLGIFLPPAIESPFFAIFCFTAVAAATIRITSYIDRKRD